VSTPGDDSTIHVILLDIEGTTTPVDFVYKTLFPYASQNVKRFLLEHSRDPDIRLLVEDLHAQHQRDEDTGAHPPSWNAETEESKLHSGANYVRWLIAGDSKCTPLKTLQGKIWQQGYARGELHGEVYADVPPALARWQRQGREVCIYSSGSVLAQQLLFRSTTAGDLTKSISRHFDTGIGAKTETASYRKIAESLGRAPGEVLFISDSIKEVEAARMASMSGLICVRGPLAPQIAIKLIRTFDDVFPD
jgi:enolase-phosphatase E1